MRKVWTIQWLHMKEFLKTPAAWVLMFVMPTVFSLIFGGMAFNAQNQKPVVNIVETGGDIDSQIISMLKRNDQFQWIKVKEEQAKENVLNQDVVAAVLIPRGIEQRIQEKQPIFDIILQRKSEQYLSLSPYLDGTARVIASSYLALGENKESYRRLLDAVTSAKEVKINQQIVQKNDENEAAINIMFVGFAIMFMMFGLSGAASTILDEKAGGTWARLFISPVSKFQITLGYLGSYFCMGWLQFAVLMVAMNLLFDTQWGNLTYLIPFASLVILCVVGFGLMIAGLVKTKPQAIALSAVLITSTCMLGGVYWSLDLVPEFMRKISLFVPQSWAMTGFGEIISGSLHTETLIKDTLALLGFTIIFFLVGLRLIKYE